MKYSDMDAQAQQKVVGEIIEILSEDSPPIHRVAIAFADGEVREFFVDWNVFERAMAVVRKYEMDSKDVKE